MKKKLSNSQKAIYWLVWTAMVLGLSWIIKTLIKSLFL